MSKNLQRINPCKLKGRHGGSRYGGREYQYPGGETVRPGCCECQERWILLSEPRHTRQSMAIRFHQHHTETRQVEAGSKRDPRDLIVAPCDETFRHKGSPGTKLFRRFLKEKTGAAPAFSGCQSVEQWLVENGLVRHDSFPGLLKPGKEFSRLESRTATASLSGAAVETGEFGPPNEAHLVNDELEPWFYSLERIQELRSTRENDLSDRIESLKRELTPAQFEAIDLVYLRNDRGASQDEIAARIGISIGSLRDRLAGAFAKIEKRFPELRRKRRYRRRSVRL